MAHFFNSILGWLYTWLGAIPRIICHDSQSLCPGSNPILSIIFGPNFVTCKVMRLDLGFQCSWGESLVKKINFPWINGRDVHYPTNEPNPAYVRSLSKGKPHPRFFKPARRFGADCLPPGMPHTMTIVEAPIPDQDHINNNNNNFGLLWRPTWIKCLFDLPSIPSPQDRGMKEKIYSPLSRVDHINNL
jgi:hypothetical protein